MSHKSIDGIKRINKDDLKKSREIVLKTIGEGNKLSPEANEPLTQAFYKGQGRVDGVFGKKLITPDKSLIKFDHPAAGSSSKKSFFFSPREDKRPSFQAAAPEKIENSEEKIKEGEREAEKLRELAEADKLKLEKERENAEQQKRKEEERKRKEQEEKQKKLEKMKKELEERKKREAEEKEKMRQEKEKEKAEEKKRRERRIKRKRTERRKKIARFKASYNKKMDEIILVLKDCLPIVYKYFSRSLLFFILIVVIFYTAFSAALLVFLLDNTWIRKIGNELPLIPAMITRKGLVDYFEFSDLQKINNLNSRELSIRLRDQSIINEIARNYNLDSAIILKEEKQGILNKRVFNDREVNKVGLARIAKIKQLANTASFPEIGNKYGDKYEVLELTKEQISGDLKELKEKEISSIITGDDGYYLYLKEKINNNKERVQYIYIKAITFNEYLDNEKEKTKIIRLIR